jgi:preprotein translocase subunit SecD
MGVKSLAAASALLLWAPAAMAGAVQPHTLELRAIIPCTDDMKPLEDAFSGQSFCLAAEVVADQTNIVEAHVAAGRMGPVIRYKLDEAGAKRFDAFTQENIMKKIGVVLDGRLVLAPTIQSRITGGGGEIPLNRSKEELAAIAAGLTAKP